MISYQLLSLIYFSSNIVSYSYYANILALHKNEAQMKCKKCDFFFHNHSRAEQPSKDNWVRQR